MLLSFLGDYCEIDASVCNETICKNLGECIEGPGFSFFCRCREGEKRSQNQYFVYVTSISYIIEENISLSYLLFSNHFMIWKGWTGTFCDVDVDECLASPCKNGGLCINVPASYTCACLFGKRSKT